MPEDNEHKAEEKRPEEEKDTKRAEAPQPEQKAAPQQRMPSKPQMDSKQVNNWAMLCHLLALAGLVIPFGNVVGPLIIWLLKREESPVIDSNGKESLNFQISISIYMIVAGFLTMILIGFVILPIVGVFGIIVVIIATLKASKGEDYRYPLCIRFIK